MENTIKNDMGYEVYNDEPLKKKIERLTINIDEAAKMLGVGYNTMLNLVHRKDFPKIQAAKRRILIPREAFIKWVNETSWME
ncbi:helix-turn-helix domain-containing protein [Caloramator sp. E03]|uniref:helix-turn-helix domain-containing protein n=1 Tax=Caloramator sp. E03 TaxID=2576307 RepID=UPI001FAA4C83|nr:helix-turn-helix domain-containing protein [Caloramator sp. E03]